MNINRNTSLRNAAWMNYLLILINVLVFVLGMAAAGSGRGADSWYRAGALYAPLLLKGQGFYRLVTSIFLHADVSHLFNNMIVQFAGGEVVEKNLGHIRYGILYIVCGIAGNLVSVASDWLTGEYGYSVGASGAVFGVIGALLYMILREAKKELHPEKKAQPVYDVFGRPLESIPADSDRPVYMQPDLSGRDVSRSGSGRGTGSARMKNLVLRAVLMTVYLLYSGWSNPVVNQAAHIGGLIAGLILAAVLMPRRDSDLSALL